MNIYKADFYDNRSHYNGRCVFVFTIIMGIIIIAMIFYILLPTTWSRYEKKFARLFSKERQ